MLHRLTIAGILPLLLILAACGGDATSPVASPSPVATAAAASTPTAALPVTIAPTAAPTATNPTPAATVGPTQTVAPAPLYPLTVKDAEGNDVTVTRRPERIACVTTCGSTLYPLGIAPDKIATTTSNLPFFQAYYGEATKAITTFASSADGPNLEEIARFNPDLILLSSPRLRDGLARIAPTVVMFEGGAIRGAEGDLTMVGTLLGRDAAAAAAVQRFRDRIAAYRAQSPRNQRVMVVAPTATGVLVWIEGSVTCAVLAEVTGCPWRGPSSAAIDRWGRVPYSLEVLLANDPDVILVPGYAYDPQFAPTGMENRRKMEGNPVWRELSAVKAGRVYTVEGSLLLSYSAAGSEKLLDIVMPQVYPQAFPRPLP